MTSELTIAAGIAGGLIMGLTGYVMAHKNGEAFDKWFFVQTCWLPVVAGVVAGIGIDDPYAAFTAGIMLKHLAEVKLTLDKHV